MTDSDRPAIPVPTDPAARIAALEAENARLRERLEREGRESDSLSSTLLESEERFRQLAELAPSGICLFDADGRCIFVNARLREMAGLPSNEPDLDRWLAAIHPEDAESIARDLAASLRSGGRFGREFRLRAAEGRETWVFAVAAPLRDVEGVARGSVVILTDLTWWKRDEELLREYERVVEQIEDIVAVVDPGHRYTLVNRRFAEMQGIPKRSILGRHAREILGEAAYAHEVAPRLDDAFSGTPQEFSMRRAYRGGEPRDLRVRYFPIFGDAGRVERVVALIHDETERVRLAERARRGELFERIGTLAGGVAHDLNNLLTPALGVADLLLLEMTPSDPLHEDLALIRRSVQNAAEEVQDLLTFARRVTLRKEPVDPERLLADFASDPWLARLRDERPELSVAFSPLRPLPGLLGSPVHLTRVLHNLVANAAEAIPARQPGRIGIECRRATVERIEGVLEPIPPGDYFELVVEDSGAGIPAEELRRVFEPFHSRKALGKRAGTGLGLAVVHGVVKDHGGYIDIKSSPGTGTRFRILLPVAADSAGDAPGRRTAEPVHAAAFSGRVLVVDDDDGLRGSVCRMLRELGATVDGAAGLPEALASLRAAPPDLVLLDMLLGDGPDGLEVYRALLAERPGLPAVVMSGFSCTGRVEMCRALGARDFLRKPFTLAALRSALERAAAPPASADQPAEGTPEA